MHQKFITFIFAPNIPYGKICVNTYNDKFQPSTLSFRYNIDN